MKTSLIISVRRSPFVVQDEDVLRKKFEVKTIELGPQRGLRGITSQIRLFFWLLFRMRRADHCFVWFGDIHAYLPALFCKVFRKKCYIVVGGYDADNRPDMNYGVLRKGIRAWAAKRSYKMATKLFCVSRYTLNLLNQNTGDAFAHKAIAIHNGVDLQVFNSASQTPKKKKVLMVANISDKQTAIVKGLDIFLELAKRLPDFEFRTIGANPQWMTGSMAPLPSNLTMMAFVDRKVLAQEYEEAMVICVPSRLESFSLVLAEGMYCKCVPVTWSGIGSAELVSEDCGYVANRHDTAELAGLIQKAAHSPEMGERASKKIENEFSLSVREKKILQEV